MKTILTMAIAALILAGLNGCSSQWNKDSIDLPQTHTVEIRQMAFVPAELTVGRGDTVVFVNNDLVDHDIREQDRDLWSSSRLQSGQSWSIEVTESANYYCSLHKVMKGKIMVQ